MGHTLAEIEHNQVVVQKETTREKGSKQFTSNYIAATETFKHGFGAAKHFVQRNKDMAWSLMTVTPIIPSFKNSVVAT